MKNSYTHYEKCFFNKQIPLFLIAFLSFKNINAATLETRNPKSEIRNHKNTEGGIKGTITDAKGSPMVGVSVQLLNTSYGIVTNESGSFEIKGVPTGKYTLRASFIGYLNTDRTIDVKNDILDLSINLSEDVLQLQEVMVTGGNSLKKVESSVAITTINSKDLQIRQPQNTTDLFRAIPGLWVENYGGNGPGNVFVRGFPQTGGYAFVGMMEDGLPVMPTNTNRNTSPDVYAKVDYTLRNVEAVRGGTASILMPNSAGMVMNMLSYTGAEKTYGKFGYQRGLNQNLNRFDGNLGGSLSKNIRYNIGGFYRTDEGVISPGFVGNRGGQMKGNVTYNFNNNKGFIRLYTKFLDDHAYWSRQSYYQYDGSGTANGFPQYDLFTQSIVPQETQISFATSNGQNFSGDYKDGMHLKLKNVGLQLHYETNGWQINNSFRVQHADYSNVAEGFNAPTLYGSTRKYYYLDGTQATVNPTDYYANLQYNIANGTDKQFVDYLDIKKQIGKNNISIGAAYHNTAIDYLQASASGIAEFKANPRRLLINKTTGNDITPTFNTTKTSFNSNVGVTKTVSVSLRDEIALTEKTRLDIGVRMDKDNITGKNPTILGTATNATPAGQGFYINGYTDFTPENHTYYSYSAGLNHKLNEAFALFARGTKSYNAVSIYDITLQGYNPANIKTRNIVLGELGARYGKNNFALFTSFVYATVENVSLIFQVPTNTGSTVRYPAFGSTRTKSAEIEATYQPFKVLGFRLISTINSAKYTDFKFTAAQDVRDDIKGKSYDWSGNNLESLPKLNFEFATNFNYKGFNANFFTTYVGKRFTAASNSVTMAAYTTLNVAVGYKVTKNLKINLNGYNMTNTRGLVAGDVRGDQFVKLETLTNGKIIPGAALFPRNFLASLVFEF
jgi:iron complex outermembrane recepter protein